jgi:superfamily II DNA or RNA helicase
MLRLRDYQEDGSNALDASLERGVRRPAIVLPTGAGKTVVFAHRALRFHEKRENLGKRVLVLAHTDELVTQAAKKIKNVAPHLQVGIVKAALNQVQAQVVVASVQSLRNVKRRNQIRHVGKIVVDECHHATAPTYLDILEHYGAIGPACAACLEEGTAAKRAACAHRGPAPEDGAVAEGFTATLARSDKSKLSQVWEEVAFKRDIAFMIRRKYLLDVRGKRIEVPDFTTKGLKTSGGDFQSEDLADRLVESLAPELVAKAYVEHAADRSGLVFTPNVSSAYVFAEALVEQGITAEVVHGALAQEERRCIIKRLETGETQVLVNCMVLTEGFDSPRVSCVVIARPTKSSPLYQQMVGRGLRLFDGQTECLVLDVVGASRQHGLASLVDLSGREDEKERDLEDGQSLLEFEDMLLIEEQEEEGQGQGLPEEYYAGPIEVVDFDPLSRDSHRVWKTTASGIHYLPMGATNAKLGTQGLYYFLVPHWGPDAEPGEVSVVWCTQDGKAANQTLQAAGLPNRPVGATEHQGLPISQAMVWAEQEVEDLAIRQGLDPNETFSKKAAPWRKREASDKQISMARGLGIPGMPALDDPFTKRPRAGEVSDLIDNVKAAQVIDQWVTFLNAQTKEATA